MAPSRLDERGNSLSAFVLVVVAALIMVAGLVIDGGAQVTATRRAEQAASEAARAAVDAGAPARASGHVAPDHVLRSAAEGVLTARGVVGTVEIDRGTARVRTTVSTRTVFLSIVGIDSLTAHGQADAVLVRP